MLLRSLLVLACVVAGARPAGANTVVVMTDPGGARELGAALEVALAGRQVRIASLPPPAGALRLDRAASAQRAAVEARAQAAMWIDVDGGGIDVCAVSADGRYFRHAPLPPDESPRVFAAIATSLLDELLAPPEAPLSVSVTVDVTTHGAVAAVPVVVAPPGLSVTAPAADPRPARWDRTLIEIGPMLSPITFGGEATLLFPLSERWRAGVMASISIPFQDFDVYGPLFAGTVELRRIGRGRRHFDIGPLAGVASADDEAVVIAGVRLGVAWEGASSGTALSIAPIILVPSDGGGPLPGAWASLRWSFPI